MADRLGVETIDREGRLVVIKFRQQARVDPVRLVKIVGEWPGATLVPPASLKIDLEAAGAPRMSAAAATRPGDGRGRPPDPRARGAVAGRKTPSRTDGTSSWWTARATAGEVKAGFTKEEILRTPDADPRAAGGMFARLEQLLRTLAA
jgi:hypothetical protein